MPLSEADRQVVATLTQYRYVIAAVLLATLWTVEALVPMYLGRQRRVLHGAANLGLAGCNAVVAYGFAFAILAVTEWSRAEGIGIAHHIAGPTWLRWVVALLMLDCWQYWWHRINHRVPFFWRFHAVHHADAEMDATSGVRFHTVEIVLSMVARLAVLPVLGITVPQLVLYELLSLPVILFHHSNIRLPRGGDNLLRWLIVTPWMHWVHHSDLQPETDSNYSSFLSVWDRLFRSFRLRDKPDEIRLGLADWQAADWRSLHGMWLAPFRRWNRRSTDAVDGNEVSANAARADAKEANSLGDDR